jgi:hypothetical protein
MDAATVRADTADSGLAELPERLLGAECTL